MEKSIVYFGSARQARLEASETLPAKLDLVLEKLNIRERVKGEQVLIKMHTGTNIGYSTIHPVFVRKVVKAVKEGGGKPFIADVTWDVEGAETRGYTQEVLGCPIYPAASIKDNYFYEFEHPFKNIKTWKLSGLVHDATFLIDFAHIKVIQVVGSVERSKTLLWVAWWERRDLRCTTPVITTPISSRS